VGKLVSVWTDLPDQTEALFATGFWEFFGQTWQEVLAGAEKTYSYHQFWDAYFAVTALKPVEGKTLADLPVVSGGGTAPLRCNIIVG